MDGVKILNEYTVYTTQLWVALIGIFAFVGTFIFLIFLLHSECAVSICVNSVCLIICFVTFVTFATIDGNSNRLKEYSHTEYKVTIDDSVSMNEFLDKYEILDQEGKIYTVKERE